MDDTVERLKARIAELEAARIAYASEFPPDAEGLPDVGNVHANIRAMKAALSAIVAIEDKMFGGDWDEIEEARSIAKSAIASTKEQPQWKYAERREE